MYEDQTQNYDPEIHEQYLVNDTPIPLPHHLSPCADYSIIQLIRLECNNFLLWLSLKSGF